MQVGCNLIYDVFIYYYFFLFLKGVGGKKAVILFCQTQRMPEIEVIFSSGSAVVRGLISYFIIKLFFFFFPVQTVVIVCLCGLMFVSEISFGMQL